MDIRIHIGYKIDNINYYYRRVCLHTQIPSRPQKKNFERKTSAEIVYFGYCTVHTRLFCKTRVKKQSLKIKLFSLTMDLELNSLAN